MVDGYKPFACTESGCSQSFASEDHLFVHGITHHSHLTSITMPPFAADQTPTPTKFLKNCDELGLFQDITRNPFDEAFSKAAEQVPVSVSTAVNSEDEDLSHFAVSPNAAITVSHAGSEIPAQGAAVSLQATNFIDKNNPVLESNELIMNSVCVNSAAGAVTVDSVYIPVTLTLPDGRTVTMNLPAQITLPNVVSIPDLPPAAVASDTAAIQTLKMESAATSGLNTVTMGSGPVGMSPVGAISLNTKRETKGSGSTLTIAATTREKLKATVHSMQQRQVGGTSGSLPAKPQLTLNIPSKSTAVVGKLPIPQNPTQFVPTSAAFAFNSGVQLRAADTSTPCRPNVSKSSSVSSDSDGSDRTKFLERQRAAANRCRQKKKQWLMSLETKTNKVETHNQRLQVEMAALKQEVAVLRAALFEHQNCPAITVDALQYLMNVSQ